MMDFFSTTLLLPEVQEVLERLHTLADTRDESIGRQVHSDPGWNSAGSQQKATLRSVSTGLRQLWNEISVAR